MRLTSVTVELSEAILDIINPSQHNTSREVNEWLVIAAFQAGKISLGKGAELLGLERLAFEALLEERNIPQSNLAWEVVQADVETLKKWKGQK